MPNKSDETWTTEVDSKYRLVILVARRSKQLQKGAKARVQTGKRKATRVALEEVRNGLIRYELLHKLPAAS